MNGQVVTRDLWPPVWHPGTRMGLDAPDCGIAFHGRELPVRADGAQGRYRIVIG